MSEETKTPTQKDDVNSAHPDKATTAAYIKDTQKNIQDELALIKNEIATIKDYTKNNVPIVAEIKSNMIQKNETVKDIETLLKELVSPESNIARLASGLERTQAMLAETGTIMKSISSDIKTLPNIVSKIESSNTLLSNIPEKHERIITRIEKITDKMDAPESRSWIKMLLRHGVNFGVFIIIILAAIGLYQLWLLLKPIFN